MSQNSLLLPTTGTVSGLQMTQYTNNALDTLNTLASGAGAPATPEAGQLWHDTTNNLIKVRSLDNTAWIPLFSVNETNYDARPWSEGNAGFVNKFRNPSFDVAQRGGANTLATGASGYTFDGYVMGGAGAPLSWSSGPGAFGSARTAQLNSASGLTDAFIKQRIEAAMAQPLAGYECTFQAVISNQTGATITPALTVSYPGSADNWTGQTAFLNNVSLQSVAAGAVQIVAYSFTAPANVAYGVEFKLDFGGALNGSGTAIATCNWDVRRARATISTGLNGNPPDPELRPVGVELPLCQRYFETSYPSGVTPGTASQTSTGDYQDIAFNTSDFNAYRARGVFFKASKRVPPSIALYNPQSGTAGNFWNYTASATGGNSAVGIATLHQFGVYCSNTALTAGSVYGTHWTASAEL
jgi:hypothetical protein